MGDTNALLELRASLKADGLDFPFWEHVCGADTNIHVAVLSKLPIVARRPHTNDFFLLDGRRFQVKRGFAEVDIQAATNFTFTLIAAHLKSRLPVPDADEAEERLGEAKVLRGIIDEHFTTNPNARLIVLGDFNDVKDSDADQGNHRARKIQAHRHAARRAQRRQCARGQFRISTRATSRGRNFTARRTFTRRMDYILLSPALERDWVKAETYIPTIPNWGVGSDHRPIVAAFEMK